AAGGRSPRRRRGRGARRPRAVAPVGEAGGMRIHRLRLVDFRGVADREVAFADSGITVVHGPNEAGKSSLTDALDMLLARHDSSEARDVRAAVPAGRDVGPYVEVEMTTGPYRFVYAKRWLRDRMTHLDVLTPLRRQLAG